MGELLDIIDYQGKVVGFAERDTIHKMGLRHPEVIVIGVLEDSRIVFQKRSLTKLVNPGGIIPFAGGHVEHGETITQALLKEVREESGLTLTESDFKFVTLYNYQKNHGTGLIDDAYLYVYACKVSSLDDLIPEVGEVEEFLAASIEDVSSGKILVSEDFVERIWIDIYKKSIETISNLDEKVALLDTSGATIGTMLKAVVHTESTPLHRAFSLFVFDQQNRLLVQQRSHLKKTWPLVWSNTCCGHPYVDESDEDAIKRRLTEELNWSVDGVELVSPYRYRFERFGVVENEICPVYFARVTNTSQPIPNPDEVEAVQWIDWSDFLEELKQDKSGDEAKWSDWCKEEAEIVVRSGILTHKNTPSIV
jgi:isopentenyl-diphosphate Delta-isomerase